MDNSNPYLISMAADGRRHGHDAVEELELPVPARKLTIMNALLCGFHATFATITLVVGNTDLKVPVYGSGVKLIVGGTNGSNIGTDAEEGFALKPDFSERATWLYLTWATACFFLLSFLFHLGNALLWRKPYLRLLASGYAPFRWVEYTFSASVMILILAYTAGTTTLPVLGFTAITMAFGHLHEVSAAPSH